VITYNVGESHGLVVKADGSRSKGRGFEPQHWIDVTNASYYIHKNNENKGSQMGHTKKKVKKKILKKEY
jgi:hypothetical protein